MEKSEERRVEMEREVRAQIREIKNEKKLELNEEGEADFTINEDEGLT